MRLGKVVILVPLLWAACNRATSVRVELSLADGATAPDAVSVSVFDRFGGVAYGVPISARLPGDLVVLVSSDSEMVRVVAVGTLAGQPVVNGILAVPVTAGRQTELPLVLDSGTLVDSDGDGVPDVIDDCPTVPDPDQSDSSGAAPGDACAPIGIVPADLALGRTAVDLGNVAPAAASDMAPISTASCGDGVVQAGEACDDGANNSDLPSANAGCTTGCTSRAACGNLTGSEIAALDLQTGHCYVAWPGPVTWASARRQCESRGGHLATITSANENAIIELLSVVDDHWIGLEVDHGQAVRDHWIDGETVGFESFASGEPNNGGSSGHTESCGAFEAMRMAWDDRPCGFPATGLLPSSYAYGIGYICENECGNGAVEPGEGCDEAGPNCTSTCQTMVPCTEAGGVVSPVNGHCYFALPSLVTFDQAMSACPSGTHLATLDSIAESEAGALAVGGSDAWIALTASVTQGDYAWTNGSDVFDSTRYHGFSGDEPNDTAAAPYCTRITPVSGWKDQQCTLTHPTLCERD
jgi:Lectin C-type domain